MEENNTTNNNLNQGNTQNDLPQNMNNNMPSNFNQSNSQITSSQEMNSNMPINNNTLSNNNQSNQQTSSIQNITTNVSGNNLDNSFVEPKKKHTGLIIIICLLILLIGGGLFYYFVLDNPKTIFINVFDKYFATTKTTNKFDKYNIEYSANLEINTQDEELEEILELIKNFSIKGNIGYDKNKKMISALADLSYKDKPLPSIEMLSEEDNNKEIYISLGDLYNRPIKIQNLESDDATIEKQDLESVKIVEEKVIASLKESLNEGKYKKEYLKLEDKNAKKLTLTIDKEFANSFVNRLINDQVFIEKYSDMNDITEDEAIDKLTKSVSDIEKTPLIISLYLNPINNNFLKLELIEEDKENISIKNIEGKYLFEYRKNNSLVYSGTIKVDKITEQEYKIQLKGISVEDKLKFSINLNTKIDYNKGANEKLLENAILLEEISEDDQMEILEKLFNNEAIAEIIKDTGLDSLLEEDSDSLTELEPNLF